jgi:hypothetical protein
VAQPGRTTATTVASAITAQPCHPSCDARTESPLFAPIDAPTFPLFGRNDSRITPRCRKTRPTRLSRLDSASHPGI